MNITWPTGYTGEGGCMSSYLFTYASNIPRAIQLRKKKKKKRHSKPYASLDLKRGFSSVSLTWIYCVLLLFPLSREIMAYSD
jgi:hypothetical protein